RRQGAGARGKGWRRGNGYHVSRHEGPQAANEQAAQGGQVGEGGTQAEIGSAANPINSRRAERRQASRQSCARRHRGRAPARPQRGARAREPPPRARESRAALRSRGAQGRVGQAHARGRWARHPRMPAAERRAMKRKRTSKGPYVAVPIAIMSTTAWRTMSPEGRLLWIELRSRLRNDGLNNGKIFRSCRDAAEALGLHKDTVARRYAENEHYGFLRKTGEGFLGS